MAKGHVPDGQTGGTDRGKLRESNRTDAEVKAEGAKASRVGRDSFAVNTPNRQNQTDRRPGHGR